MTPAAGINNCVFAARNEPRHGLIRLIQLEIISVGIGINQLRSWSWPKNSTLR